MNNKRRKQLDNAKKYINLAIEIIEDVMDEEDFAFNNLSEGLQQTMRGEQMEENVSEMEECLESLNEIIENLDNID